MEKVSVLIVDDQPELLNTLRRLLQKDFHVITCSGGKEALQELNNHEFAVILCDQRMPEMDGVTFLSESLKIQPDTVRLLITGYADIEATIGAVNHAKVARYISKPFEPDELKDIVQQAADDYLSQKQVNEAQEQLLTEKLHLQKQVEKQLDLGNLIGNSAPMLNVLKLVRKVVDTPTTVLILGETGTGKELLAKIIHYNSNRRDKMFVVQNCGAIPDTLLQSELFGHVKGAFTGAIKDKKGLFELADKGTIFLDEIGDTSPALQLGLLRVLQEGELKPLGATNSKKVDVRVIAATNRDLQKEVNEGRFREDLFYRLSVFPIQLPPLHERRDDIPDLVQFFIEKFSGRIGKSVCAMSPQTLQRLMAADYPGNIRELENEIERMITLADDGEELNDSHLSQKFLKIADMQKTFLTATTDLKQAIDLLERQMIRDVLHSTRGNVLRSAEKLGISRVGLHKMLQRHKINKEEYKLLKE